MTMRRKLSAADLRALQDLVVEVPVQSQDPKDREELATHFRNDGWNVLEIVEKGGRWTIRMKRPPRPQRRH